MNFINYVRCWILKKKIIIIAIIFATILAGVLYFCYDYAKYANPVIDIHSCVSVEIENKSEDEKVITEIAHCINSAKKKRMIFPEQTLHSPTMIISFNMEDGTKDSVWIYGEYVLYRPKYDKIQYKFDDVSDIYKVAAKYHLD